MNFFKIVGIFLVAVLFALTAKSCIIQDPKPEECEVVTTTIIGIKAGTSFDIYLYDNNGDYYYINRGMERGLEIPNLKKKLLNKQATMHLPKFAFGTSEHIAQLTVDGDTLFTEFK